MSELTQSVRELINEFAKLPGIGKKSAERLAYHVLRVPQPRRWPWPTRSAASRRMSDIAGICYNLAEEEECDDLPRSQAGRELLCVVEQPRDLMAPGAVGRLSRAVPRAAGPDRSAGRDRPRPADIDALVERVRAGRFKEVIMATNPTVEGDGTALHISNLLAELPVQHHPAGPRHHHRQRARIRQQGDSGRRPDRPAEVLSRRPSRLHATIVSRSRTATWSQKQSAGAADDPVDGDSAVADPGAAGADRAGDRREPGARAAARTTRTCPPSRPRVREPPRRADRGRARAGDRRDNRQRGRLRAADEDGRGVARPLREAPASLAQPDGRGGASASTTPWPTWSPGRSRCNDYLHDQLGWFDLEPRVAAMAERIIYNLDPTATCSAAWKTCSAPTPTPRRPGAGAAGAGGGAEARPARRRRPRPARVPAAATRRPACRTTSSSRR